MKYNSSLLFSFMIFSSTLSFGQPGSLDANFDADGKVVTDIAGGDDYGRSMALQPDGKIIVTGSSSSKIMVARYNPDGSMDNSFGLDGVATTEITSQDYGSSVVLQPDGKIVVAGQAFERICLVRYNTDGSLDDGFGLGGIVVSGFGEFARGRSVVLQPDGKILVACSALINGIEQNFIILRYNTDGSLDNTFSFDGTVTTDFNGKYDRAVSIKVQADEKIVVAGYSGDGSNFDNSDFAAARYNTDGTLDNSFGTNGKVTTDFLGGRDFAASMVLQPDGKILLIGYHVGNDNSDFATLRYNVDGSLDSTFNGDGKSIMSFGIGNAFGSSIALQPDGKILLAGSAFNGNDSDFALARITSEGIYDITFGSLGQVFTDFGGQEQVGNEIVLQSDGNFLVAGYTSDVSFAYDIAVAKYLSGLNIGVIEFSKQDHNLLIYPNPLQDDAVIEYTLADDEIISIDLYDISGRLMQSIVNSEERVEGSHREPLNLNASIPSGSYILTLSNGEGSSNISVIK